MKKDMKIKLWDGNREKVIALLEGAGHRRAASGMEFYDRAAYIYTYADDEVITHGGTKEIFNNHPNEEHWLADGALCSLSYWTQPVTANIPERYKNPVTDADKAMKDAYDTVCEQLSNSGGGVGYFSFHKDYSETTYEPLGITPRADFLRNRSVEILQAMLRYTEASITIPSTWFLELEDNNEELDK